MSLHLHDVSSLLALGMLENWLAGIRSGNTHSDLCGELRATLGISLLDQEIDEIICDAIDRDHGAEWILARLLEDQDADWVAKPR